jgi:putative SOS response-associated peptidase YedK
VCGRTTLTNESLEEIAGDLDAELAPEDAALYRPRYNAAPSDLGWVVEYGADRRVLRPAVWGYLASGRPLINVRGEQVASGRGFRHAFEARRCVVVTDGFYEWDARKAPFWYHREGGGLVLLAGLFQPPAEAAPPHPRAAPPPHPRAAPPRDAGRQRFTILTTRPNRLVAEVHDRMPVVVAAADVDEWLTAPPAEAARLIAPAPDGALAVRAVSRRVGSVKNDDPACLAPAEPGGDGGGGDPRQRSLF